MAWHIVQTAPQRETKVAREIERLGFQAYCPLEPYRVRISAVRHRTAFRAMLPGYVFAGWSDGQEWQPVREIRHARRVFMVDMKPVPVADPIIEAIGIQERELGLFRRPRRSAGFRVGQIIKPNVGPMRGFLGTVADVKRDSVCVEFVLFGRLTRSWMRGDQIEAV